MPVFYVAGLAFLRRQFRQEEEDHRKKLTSSSEEYVLLKTQEPYTDMRESNE